MSLQKWVAHLKRSIRAVIIAIILVAIVILILFALAGYAEGSTAVFTPQKLGGLGFMALLFVAFLVWVKDRIVRWLRGGKRRLD